MIIDFQTFMPVLKYGIVSSALAAIIATESEGVTKNPLPRIMFRSPSPEIDKIWWFFYRNRSQKIFWGRLEIKYAHTEQGITNMYTTKEFSQVYWNAWNKKLNLPSLAAPKSGPFSPYNMLTKSLAYLFQSNKLKSVIVQESI